MKFEKGNEIKGKGKKGSKGLKGFGGVMIIDECGDL